jgi:hypothetical protein
LAKFLISFQDEGSGHPQYPAKLGVGIIDNLVRNHVDVKTREQVEALPFSV